MDFSKDILHNLKLSVQVSNLELAVKVTSD